MPELPDVAVYKTYLDATSLHQTIERVTVNDGTVLKGVLKMRFREDLEAAQFQSSRSHIHIGTSGWHYVHWKGPFYPKDVKSKDFLSYYTKSFSTAEINNSFYRLPEEKTLVTWRDTVPSDFIFSVKASRYITHMKKLKDPEEGLSRFLNRIDTLGKKLGPILFQLPPKWKCNRERLKSFLKALPKRYKSAFEFRDPSWLIPEVYDLLSEHGAALCIFDLQQTVSPKEVTANFVYVRLHGPAAEKYEGQYDVQTLAGWAGAFSTWARRGKEIFCYFDNDQHGYAAIDAKRLEEMLSAQEHFGKSFGSSAPRPLSVDAPTGGES